MDTKYLFYITLVISIIVQIITGIIEIGAFFVKVPTMYSLIKQLLIIELVVQFFEGMFYFWLAYNFTKVLNVTPKRYIDWVITTPTMLITLISYMLFLQAKAKNSTQNLNLSSIFKSNYKTLIPILILNWMMLLFGYLGEVKVIPIFYSAVLGFIPFFIYYYMIYKNFVDKNTSISGYNIYIYFVFFWGLYGIAAFLPYYIKNIIYNILDLFSKNFFGIFLAYIIYTRSY